MNAKTREILDTLEAANWFSAIGKRDLEGVGYVASWLHAAASFSGSAWKSARLEGMNVIRDRVQSKSRARYQDWNKHVDIVKPSLIKLCEEKTAAVMAANQLPKEFYFCVCGSINGVLMDAEYSDVIEPGFFTNVIFECYLKGHFPCGWEGEFPNGRLIVY